MEKMNELMSNARMKEMKTIMDRYSLEDMGR